MASPREPTQLAITVWDGWVSPVFDACTRAIVFDIPAIAAVHRRPLSLRHLAPRAKIQRLLSEGVSQLICGAISQPVLGAARDRGLNVIPFVAGRLDDVVEAFLRGDLPTTAFTMPGCSQAPPQHEES